MFNKFYCFVADNYFKRLTEVPLYKKMAAAQPVPRAKRKREEEDEG